MLFHGDMGLDAAKVDLICLYRTEKGLRFRV